MALKREDVKLFAENKAKVCRNNDGVDISYLRNMV